MNKSIFLENKQKCIQLNGSKSVIQRLLTMISYSHASVELKNYSDAEDILTFEDTMVKLGYKFTKNSSNVKIDYIGLSSDNINLFIKNSASAYRFLITRLANYPGLKSTITMSDQLSTRPSGILYDAVKAMSGNIEVNLNNIEVKGTKLSGKNIEIDHKISSQFISSILLSAPYFSTPSEIIIHEDQVSRNYIDLTIKMMKQYGIEIFEQNNVLQLSNNQQYHFPASITIPGDMSSACYFASLGALSETGIEIAGIDKNQSDFEFFNLLEKMGADVLESSGKTIVRKNQLHGIKVDMSNMPDQVLTLAILALFADRPTTITGISHLVHKESDRINAITHNFLNAGFSCKFDGNQLVIYPLKNVPMSFEIDTFNDHRVVMSFSILKTVFPYLTLSETKSVNKSCPDFFRKISDLEVIVKRF